MAMKKNPLEAFGVEFAGSATPSTTAAPSIPNIGMFPDDEGNLNFTDDYVKNILGQDSVSLRELYQRVKGIFYKDGQLYFKDSSLSRAYSLEEIVGSCRRWRQNLVAGSLWWLGRGETDHSACANLPTMEEPLGPNRIWSIDQYLQGLEQGTAACGDTEPLTFYQKVINPATGEWRWWDVPGMEIVIPPIEDDFKVAMFFVNLAFSCYNCDEPIVFRLFDQTANKELVRSAVVQGNANEVSYPVSMNYFGQLTNLSNCVSSEGCGCVELECIEGDLSCPTLDTGTVITRQYDSGSHLIKVQFHIKDLHTNPYERVFGNYLDGEYLTTSSLDAVIFDTNPNARFGKNHNTVEFVNTDQVEVLFDQPAASTDYSISLSCSKNVNVWFTSKTTAGFLIRAELPFSGSVDWTTINLNPNRNA